MLTPQIHCILRDTGWDRKIVILAFFLQHFERIGLLQKLVLALWPEEKKTAVHVVYYLQD